MFRKKKQKKKHMSKIWQDYHDRHTVICVPSIIDATITGVSPAAPSEILITNLCEHEVQVA